MKWAKISSRNGMAAMFDSLIFLTAVSVVALGGVLLSIHSVKNSDSTSQELVERTHAMLCRMTIQPPNSEGDGQNGSGTPPLTIGVISLALLHGTNGKVAMPAWLSTTVSNALEGILEPHYTFNWKLTDGTRDIWLSSGPTLPSDGDVYVSIMDLGGSPPVKSALYIW